MFVKMKGPAGEIDERTLRRALDQWNPNLYQPQYTFWGYCTPLSLAAEAGFTALAEDIIVRGFTDLLKVQDNDGWYPVQGALKREKYGTATYLLKNMPEKRYRRNDYIGPFTLVQCS